MVNEDTEDHIWTNVRTLWKRVYEVTGKITLSVHPDIQAGKDENTLFDLLFL